MVDLLVHLLELLYSLSSASQTIAMTTEQKEFDPVLIIAHLLKEIASGNEQCRQVLCNERFISALIAPLQSSEVTCVHTHIVVHVTYMLLVHMCGVYMYTTVINTQYSVALCK